MISIVEHLDYAAYRYFDKDAVVQGGTRLSYADFVQRVDAAKRLLVGRGVSYGDSVALLEENTPSLLVWFYAVMCTGARAVLLNRRLTIGELAYDYSNASCSGIVYGQNYIGHAHRILDVQTKEMGGRLDRGPFALVADIGESEAPQVNGSVCELASVCPLASDDDAFVLFTGGSTGRPKAAVFSHGNLANWIDSKLCSDWNVVPQDVLLLSAPLYHMSGLDAAFSALSTGATLVLSGAHFDADEQLDLIEKECVTKAIVVPVTSIELLASANQKRMRDLSSVSAAVMEGSAASDELLSKAFDVFPNAAVLYSYGMTENAVATNIRHTREEWMAHPERHLSIGRPALYSRVNLVDEEGRPVPNGTPGRVLGRSPCMCRGYTNTDLPFNADGWFDTGDVMRRDSDGYLYFVGRTKLMIKTGGENVFAGEVESVIREHPAVFNCIVFGVPNKKWGEAVVAAVQLRAGHAISERDIIGYCRSQIAHYKQPQHVYFLEELPLNLAGKVDEKKTKSLLDLP